MIVCDPEETLLKICGLAPPNIAPPSNCHVNGATPVNAVAVMLPFATIVQDVGIEVVFAVTPGPIGTSTTITFV